MGKKLKIEIGYRILTVDSGVKKDRYRVTVGSLLEWQNTEEILLYRENIEVLRNFLNEILANP